jgi:hypothetical protein
MSTLKLDGLTMGSDAWKTKSIYSSVGFALRLAFLLVVAVLQGCSTPQDSGLHAKVLSNSDLISNNLQPSSPGELVRA